jgi:excisionase family DNA binding protein
MVRKGSGQNARPLHNTESPVSKRDSEHPPTNLKQSPGASGGVLGATGCHVGALPDTPGRPAIARPGCSPERRRSHLRAGANGLTPRQLSAGVRESGLRANQKATDENGSRMQASQATRTRRAAGAVEPSRELADLLALAGAERAGRVLALLRELLLMPSPEGEQPDLMTLEQVAERLQVSPRTIRRAIDAGDLEAVDLPFRVGLRVKREVFEKWLSENTAVEAPVSSGARRSGRLELSDL